MGENAKKKMNYVLIMIVYLLGIFMGAIDTGIVTPARTVIQNDLMVNNNTGIWKKIYLSGKYFIVWIGIVILWIVSVLWKLFRITSCKSCSGNWWGRDTSNRNRRIWNDIS